MEIPNFAATIALAVMRHDLENGTQSKHLMFSPVRT